MSIPKNLSAYADVIRDQHHKRRNQRAADRYAEQVKNGEEGALNILLSSVCPEAESDEQDISELLSRVADRQDKLSKGEIEPGVPTGIAYLDRTLGGFQGLNPWVGKSRDENLSKH